MSVTPSFVSRSRSVTPASYRGYRANPGAVARAARSMLNNRTAGFLGVEKKFYDTTLAASAIATSTDATGGELDPSATSMISTPAQGDGEQQRDGKKIVIESVQVKGTVYQAVSANQTSGIQERQAFLALVLDMQTNAAQLNSEDVFKNLAGDAFGAVNPLRNLLQSSRFKVLRIEKINMPIPHASWDGTNIEIGGATCSFDWFVKFPGGGLPVNFNAGTTASVANVVDNSLHVIGFATAALSLTYNARIRFMG